MLNQDFLHIILHLKAFYGINKKKKIETLESIKKEQGTVIFYEAPHKLVATLKEMYNILGQRNICIARELTKIYEEYKKMTLTDAINYYSTNLVKGEIVLLVEGVSKEAIEKEQEDIYSDKNVIELVKELIKEGLTKKEAIKKVAKIKNIDKNEVYKECLEI